MKKIISTLLLLAIWASAGAYDFMVDGIAYKKNSDSTSVTVTSGGSYSGSISIPSEVVYNGNTYPVTSIGNDAFFGCIGLTSVTMPNSVTEIGISAFYYCRNLTEVTIPNSVKTIGDKAFYNCLSLTSVTIPNSVTSIGGAAFGACSQLKEFCVDSENPSYCTVDGVLHNKAKTTLVAYPNAHGSSYTILNSVTYIGRFAFEGCSGLTTVTIPNSVKKIGTGAFYNCSKLTEVAIGNSVTEIVDYAFYKCYNLKSVYNLSLHPQEIDKNVFYNVDIWKTTLHVPHGSSGEYGSADVWKSFGKIEEMPPAEGDINGDGKVDVVDMNLIINKILGLGEIDDIQSADLNGDLKIDVQDLNSIINIILGIQ